jgi:hypothetical protein
VSAEYAKARAGREAARSEVEVRSLFLCLCLSLSVFLSAPPLLPPLSLSWTVREAVERGIEYVVELRDSIPLSSYSGWLPPPPPPSISPSLVRIERREKRAHSHPCI